MDAIISRSIKVKLLIIIFMLFFFCLFTFISIISSDINERDKYIKSWAKIAPGSFISLSATGYRIRLNKTIGDQKKINNNDPLLFLY